MGMNMHLKAAAAMKKKIDELGLQRDEEIAVNRNGLWLHHYYRGHDGEKLTVAYFAGPDDSFSLPQNGLAGWVEVDCPLHELKDARRFKEQLPRLSYGYVYDYVLPRSTPYGNAPSNRRPHQENYGVRCGGFTVSAGRPLFPRRISRSVPWGVR